MESGGSFRRERCVTQSLRFAPLAILALGMAILSASASPLQAHDERIFGDWVLMCVSDQETQGIVPCEIVQAVFERGGDVPVLRLALAYAGDRDVFGMHMSLPADTQQSAGIVMRLNAEKDFEYVVSSCDASKCVGIDILYPDQILALTAADSAFVATVRTDGSLRRVPISLRGLDAAIEAVTERNLAWATMRADYAAD